MGDRVETKLEKVGAKVGGLARTLTELSKRAKQNLSETREHGKALRLQGSALKRAQEAIVIVEQGIAGLRRQCQGLSTDLDRVASKISRTERRLETAEEIRAAVWRVWGHCVKNAGSLDSERQCKQIEQLIWEASQKPLLRADQKAGELRNAKRDLARVRKELRELKGKRT